MVFSVTLNSDRVAFIRHIVKEYNLVDDRNKPLSVSGFCRHVILDKLEIILLNELSLLNIVPTVPNMDSYLSSFKKGDSFD